MLHFDVFLSQLPNYTNHNIQRPVRKYLQKSDKYCLSVKILHIKSTEEMKVCTEYLLEIQ
jgi:hypothetical protein